jgi:hypothetical protein
VDIMAVIHQFSNLHTNNLHWLTNNLHWVNYMNIRLIPKKEGAEEITNFQPISLIRAIAKLVSKMMDDRLAPFMNVLISNAQSAFIKNEHP